MYLQGWCKEVLSPLVFCSWRQKTQPNGLSWLSTLVKDIAVGIRSPPGLTLPLSAECTKLHAACKGTPSNVKERWWDTDFLQRNAQEEGLLFNDASGLTLPLSAECTKLHAHVQFLALGQAWPPMEASVIPGSRPSRHWKLATRSWYEHRKR